MQLILVRHALPERVDGDDGNGNGNGADPALTPRGREQARRLLRAVADEPVDALVSSPMARARETAAPLAEARGREAVVHADLREYDAERTGYVPIDQMATADPQTWERMRSGLLPAFVDAEAFTERVVAAVEDVVADHPGRATAVLVAHAGVINAYLASVLGVPVPLPFPLDYVGVSRVVCARGGRRRVRSVNETGHVADLLDVRATRSG